jgi:hypothetical protein
MDSDLQEFLFKSSSERNKNFAQLNNMINFVPIFNIKVKILKVLIVCMISLFLGSGCERKSKDKSVQDYFEKEDTMLVKPTSDLSKDDKFLQDSIELKVKEKADSMGSLIPVKK